MEIIHKKTAVCLQPGMRGLRQQGEYIAFLDSDDMISSEYYEWAIKLLQHYDNVSFIGCWANTSKAQKKYGLPGIRSRLIF